MSHDKMVDIRAKMVKNFTECGHFGVGIVKKGALFVKLPLVLIPLHPSPNKISRDE